MIHAAPSPAGERAEAAYDEEDEADQAVVLPQLRKRMPPKPTKKKELQKLQSGDESGPLTRQLPSPAEEGA